MGSGKIDWHPRGSLWAGGREVGVFTIGVIVRTGVVCLPALCRETPDEWKEAEERSWCPHSQSTGWASAETAGRKGRRSGRTGVFNHPFLQTRWSRAPSGTAGQLMVIGSHCPAFRVSQSHSGCLPKFLYNLSFSECANHSRKRSRKERSMFSTGNGWAGRVWAKGYIPSGGTGCEDNTCS